MSGADLVEDTFTNTNSRETATQSADLTDQELPSPTATHAASNLTLLTLNAQKAGANSPSMADIIQMIDKTHFFVILRTMRTINAVAATCTIECECQGSFDIPQTDRQVRIL